jgi:tRNA threonylcarbamoyladenosine biosynthesis protein TsaE
MVKEFKVSNISDLKKVFDFLELYLKPKTLFLFSGDLGAGKTTFIRHWLGSLGVENVHSPTYAFHLKYHWNNLDVSHFDLYRVESMDEIESIGFWDFFSNENQVMFVEWAERISDDDWPLSWQKIDLRMIKNSEDQREIKIRID